MHSFKVAQVAQRIAQGLNSQYERTVVDPDVVYAAGLAHDLGHPPFGHAAESELQRILEGKVRRDGSEARDTPLLRDSFEGNAQSFRIVSRLAVRKAEERIEADIGNPIKVGLNLTWRTYAAILKYPWTRGNHPSGSDLANKWGVYDSEVQFLERSRGEASMLGLWGSDSTRSLEAQVMDWADDVAYAVHDTEDFFRARLIPLDRLFVHRARWQARPLGGQGSISEWHDLVDDVRPRVQQVIRKLQLEWDEGLYVAACEQVCSLFPSHEYHGDSATRERLHLFASESIRFLTSNLRIQHEGGLHVPVAAIMQAEFLKKLTRSYVINRADLVFDQHGQRGIVRRLFFDLLSLVYQGWLTADADAMRSMPSRLQEYCAESTRPHMSVYGTDEAKLARATVDFICSLTDRQAAILARRLSGDVQSASISWVSI